MRILFVDDEGSARQLAELAPAWNCHGVEVRAVGSVAAAYGAIVDGYDPHAVVTDLRMPGGAESQGMALIERVTERCPDVVCAVISAYLTTDLAERLRSAGVMAFTKPCDLGDVAREVNARAGVCNRCRASRAA